MSTSLTLSAADDVIPMGAFKAAAAFEATGSDEEAATAAKVSIATIRDWRGQFWWPLACEVARNEINEGLRGRMSTIISKALDNLEDRLVHGEERIDKEGRVVQVMVDAKDSAVIAGVLMDKQQTLAGKPSKIVGHLVGPNPDRLRSLAQPLESVPEAEIADPLIPAGSSKVH